MIYCFYKAFKENILKISNYDIPYSGEKELRLAFVSDLHGCDNAPIIEALKSIRPDAVLGGGDYIHDAAIYKSGLDFLKSSASLFPTFTCIGNHELKFGGDIRALLKETGAVILDNSAERFEGVILGGLTTGFKAIKDQGKFKKTPPPNIEFIEKFASLRGFKILLSHHPEYYPKFIKARDIDLTLSGHAHGGQWCFFGRGVFAPGQGPFPKYTAGMYDGKLIVSRGLGNQVPFPRINNPTEIIVIRLLPYSQK